MCATVMSFTFLQDMTKQILFQSSIFCNHGIECLDQRYTTPAQLFTQARFFTKSLAFLNNGFLGHDSIGTSKNH